VSEPNPELTTVELTTVLRERFGFPEFRPGQQACIEALLAGGNLLAIQPTGYGKSLLYQLPAAILEGMTVVVSPLLALVRDQLGHLNERFDLPAASVNSDQSEEENLDAREAAAAGAGQAAVRLARAPRSRREVRGGGTAAGRAARRRRGALHLDVGARLSSGVSANCRAGARAAGAAAGAAGARADGDGRRARRGGHPPPARGAPARRRCTCTEAAWTGRTSRSRSCR
jgi:hypothetical protein